MKTRKQQTNHHQDSATTDIARVAAGIGIGVVAGLVGTAVMTAAQMIEMQYSGRESSDTPYKAVKKTFGIEAQSDEDKELITNVSHFGYGTTWGIPRGIMAVLGADGVTGTTAHFGAVWGTELSLLPAMDVMEPVTTWKPKAIAEDAMFHAVYAIATGITADILAKWLRGKDGNN
ncbi:hypothetical protein ABID22_003130 [Pontibacter aydingkolensis]|uniref:DUF1440 domain-containing protein n=1 Tax=Pontibacter aydingkolensis TaxID=1911536 RepID=A0ABS7CXW5_9BACT|nr:hypothetical protein [Pontibacter aydingkolensis]MBW7468711.1 hypothetical protein [Pontibacter aydingkolensis]